MKQKIRRSLAVLVLTCIAAPALAAPGIFNVAGDSARILGTPCFRPPSCTPGLNMEGMKCAGEQATYKFNQDKFAVCRLGNQPGRLLAAAAALSRQSVVDAAQAMIEIEAGLNIKSEELTQMLERVQAKKSSAEVDYKDASNVLALEAAKIAAVDDSNASFVASPDLKLQIEKATQRLNVALTYSAQAAATTVYVARELAMMTPTQQQNFANAAAKSYNMPNSFVGSAVDTLKSLPQSVMASYQAMDRAGKLKSLKGLRAPKSEVEKAYSTSEARMNEILAAVPTGTV